VVWMIRLVFSERRGEYWATCFKVLKRKVSRVLSESPRFGSIKGLTCLQYASVSPHHRSQSHQYELCSLPWLAVRAHSEILGCLLRNERVRNSSGC